MGNIDSLQSDVCKGMVRNVAAHMPAAVYGLRQQMVNDIGKKTNKGCNVTSDPLPYVWSYHIHVLWDQIIDTSSRDTANAFMDRFTKEFAPNIEMCHKLSFLTDLWNKNSTGVEDHMLAETCQFSIYSPGGPFYHWERGFLISPTTFH